MRWKPLTRTEGELKQWHSWFAWHPVRAATNTGWVTIWLERVDRKMHGWRKGAMLFDYRVPEVGGTQ